LAICGKSVNVSLGEKVKYEVGMRGAIMNISRGGFQNLRELMERSRHFMDNAKREFSKDLYMKLWEYLRIVVPELERHDFYNEIVLGSGINVMDLSDMKVETQSLVIASVLEYASSKLDHILIVIPEAWEQIPQSRMTPVKIVAANFIRKGAAIGNFLIIDSQDIAGIDKEPLRQCDNWVLGRQKDKREVDRTLEEIFKNRPSAEEVMTLPRGVFYACLSNDVFKVYVQPSWMDEATARKIALGEIKVENIERPKVEEGEDLTKEEVERLNKELQLKDEQIKRTVEAAHNYKVEADKQIKSLDERVRVLSVHSEDIKDLSRRASESEKRKLRIEELEKEANTTNEIIQAKKNRVEELTTLVNNETAAKDTALKLAELMKKEIDKLNNLKHIFADLFIGELLQQGKIPTFQKSEQVELQVGVVQPSLRLTVERKVLNLTDKDLLGKVAILYSEGLFDKDWFSVSTVYKGMEAHSWNRDPHVSAVLDDMTRHGFFTKRQAGKRSEYKSLIFSEDAKRRGWFTIEEKGVEEKRI
jgi:hypothetical protein